MVPGTGFFSSVRGSLFRGKLSPGQVSGLSALLAAAPTEWSPEWLAYALATTFHETGATMQPIEEWGKGAGRAYAQGGYWGRGYVQLTWKYNYALWQTRLGVPLVAKPALALTPAVALPVLFQGMALGLFTGKKLGDYFGEGFANPEDARRIINGTDRAELVAGYFGDFLEALEA